MRIKSRWNRSVIGEWENVETATLQGANLTGANLREAHLSKNYLLGARMRHADIRTADLSLANLVGANLADANLSRTDLSGAKLTFAFLNESNLSGAKLAGTELIGADLSHANLQGADLSSADLSYANLSFANLSYADFRQTTLDHATMAGTTIASVDLSESLGLELVEHLGSSTIGASTLAKSRGEISDCFLKGCGFSDWEVYAARLHQPDLTTAECTDIAYWIADRRSMDPLQPNSIFISYSHSDEHFVDELQVALDNRGVRTWRDIHHAEAGPLDRVIDRAIYLNPTVVLVLSEASVDSEWVRWEAKKAIAMETKSKRPVLCPIALDSEWRDCGWPGWLRERIEEYNVLDFSAPGSLETQMPRLLKGLNLHYRDHPYPDPQGQPPRS